MQSDKHSKMQNLTKDISDSIFKSGLDFMSVIGLLEVVKLELISSAMEEETNIVSLAGHKKDVSV